MPHTPHTCENGACRYPTRPGARYCRRCVPDPVAVLRALTGWAPSFMTMPEKLETIRELARRGFSDRQIGEKLAPAGGTTYSVMKARQRYGIPAGVRSTRDPKSASMFPDQQRRTAAAKAARELLRDPYGNVVTEFSRDDDDEEAC